MMNRFLRRHISLLSLLLAVALAACDVHEFPEEPAPSPPEPESGITLTLTHEQEFGFHKLVTYGRDDTSRADALTQVRHIIRIYPAGTLSRVGTRVPLVERSVTHSEAEGLDWSMPLSLDPGDYDIVVWTDHAAAGDDSDNYYSTADFSDIRLIDSSKHPANTDLRDAFHGMNSFSVAEGAKQEVVVSLERPMAKLRFVADDLEDFVTRGNAATDVQLQGYKARLIYAGYMPCAYNVFTGRPSDSRTGVYFEKALEVVSDTEVNLGEDYVFVNHNEGKVMVAVQILSPAGQVVAQTDALEVPLMRSKLTEVRGKFLTATSSGGVGVVPDFAGDFDVEIL